MAPEAHFRQRHGSDALRLERFSEESERPSYDPSSSNDAGADHNDDSLGSTPPTPRTRGLTLSSTSLPASQSRHHRSHSSAYMSPREASTTFARAQAERLQQPLSPYGNLSIVPSPTSATMDEATPIDKRRPQIPITPTWSNMPFKSQLAILSASRFVDFFQMAALQTYMVHQLKSFDPSSPDSVISHQAGVLQGSFTAAQIITSILWGRLADRPTVGRKLVLNIGLVGTGISMLGVGFSSTYAQAVAWRMLGGAINGTVGAARTMVAETVPKQWHPRAFLLLPAAFNVANVAGPILGGLLVEPVESFPALFGEGSTFGGSEGVAWMRKYPYATANLLSTVLLFAEAVLVQLYLRETLKGYQGTPWREVLDVRKTMGKLRDVLSSISTRKVREVSESAMLKRGLLAGREDGSFEMERVHSDLNGSEKLTKRPPPRRLPFRRIWTSNVLWTLLTIAIFDFHMGAFNNLWILFLSTSRTYISSSPGMSDPNPDPDSNPIRARSTPFKFTGGLAFPPPTIGFAMAILGFIGVTLQFALYPYVNGKFGLMRCFRSSLFFFPLAYFLAPYIALLPSTSPSPEPASGGWVWLGIALVLTLQVAARTFALPASIILLNNSSPHPSVLATIHGLGQADSATFRTLGPILAGGWYGTWLERGVVGMAWWIVAAVSAIGCWASFYVRNGSGHEVFLEGEEEEGAERSVGSMVQSRRDSGRT